MWGEKQSCLVLTFDFDAEEVWIGEDPANAERPGVLSQGTYGAKVALPLVLSLLRERQLPATFFVPGRVAERYGARVREILDAGHEVAVHGYTHRSPTNLSMEEEREELALTLEVLRDLGADPVGYRSPSWDFSPNTLGLLAQAGLSYSSNLMDDIRPYVHERVPLVELPVQWILDDAPHFWFDGIASWSKKISTTSEVREIWEQELLGIHELGGVAVLTMHPQIIGRPSRLKMLAELVDTLLARDDIWFASARDVAAAVLAEAGHGHGG